MIRRIAAPALAALTLAASAAMPLAAGAAPKNVETIVKRRAVPLLSNCLADPIFAVLCGTILVTIERQIEEFRNRF
jgi:phosphate-selective porin